MTARILIYADEQGNPYYLPADSPPITMQEVAQDILRNFEQRPQDIPLFTDHNWGKAYGWVRTLEEKEDGLYAFIELNSEGEQLVASESYKYVSPGIQRDIQLPNGEILEGWNLVEVSLTNMPAQFGAAVIQLARMHSPNTSDATNLEDATMNSKQIAGAILELLSPIQERIERIEMMLQQHEQRDAEESLRAKEADLESTILSWRYENEQIIPPAVARSYAKLLARLPEHERTDALNLLRNNPPTLVPLARAAQLTSYANSGNKYAKQLGVSLETLEKYKEVR